MDAYLYGQVLEKDMIWGRRGEPAHHTKPFSVKLKNTLVADDTFKAGWFTVYLNS